MLLYSTILNTTAKFDKYEFMQIVEEWNQGHSAHPENIIPDLSWNGEREIRFGSDLLWMRIIDLEDKNVIAVRYEKHGNDGMIWDTDYTFNYGEHKISIQLYRSYEEGHLETDKKFSAPHFISLLITHGCLMPDHELQIDNISHRLSDNDIYILTNLIAKKTSYTYPVVYVSRTRQDGDPVDVDLLASRLKGAAHVISQESVRQCFEMHNACNAQEEYWGEVGIYYPNGSAHQRFQYRSAGGYDKDLFETIHRCVLEYANNQIVPALYTWYGVRNELHLEDNAATRSAVESAKKDIDEYITTADEYYESYQRQLSENKQLSNDCEMLRAENERLRQKLLKSNQTPIVCYGHEKDLFEDEIKDIVLSTLEQALQTVAEGSRRHHVLEDLLVANPYDHISKQKKEKLKELLTGYRTMTPRIKEGLSKLGFEVTNDGKHIKVVYFNDKRYVSILPCTGSDYRGGQNAFSEISGKVF